ncbi:MAG: NAD(P)-dependent oxidoreductase [Bacteroidota bacterium]
MSYKSKKMNITFAGLGIMGSRMAANLLKHNVNLTIWNRSAAPAKKLEEQGAKCATSLNEAVKEADIVFTMFSTPEVVREQFLLSHGALVSMKKGALWIDCTTVNPSFTKEAAQAAESAGVKFIDAPVAGTKPHAENAQLSFFVGASASDITSFKPYLDMMGAKTIPLGSLGQGSSFKMLVNILLAQSMVIFSEAILLGEKLGLGRDFLLNVLPGLVVSAPFTKFKAEMVRNNDYEVQFPLEWMYKDLHLATVTAYESGQPLYLANLTKEIYAAAKDHGMGRLDFAAIHQYLEGKNLMARCRSLYIHSKGNCTS